MSLPQASGAVRYCAPVFRKTPSHVHPVINLAAEVCPVLPKYHPTRNLQTMGSSLWAKFEKECPFAKVVKKNFGTAPDPQAKARECAHVNPLKIYPQDRQVEKAYIVTPEVDLTSKTAQKQKAPVKAGMSSVSPF